VRPPLDPSRVVDLLREALYLALLLGAPPLVAGLVASLVLGLLQGATQLHDPALAAIPRYVVVLFALAAAGPFIGAELVRFARALLLALPMLGP
jgi:flagellar biosynthesis protein FliQ